MGFPTTRAALTFLLLTILAQGCAATSQVPLSLSTGESIAIAGIDNCDDYSTEPVRLTPNRPVYVLVHGCKASSSRLNTLEKVFEAHGSQTVCFNYNYRDRIRKSSQSLRHALHQLARWIPEQEIIIVGHSQGGLVARAALTDEEDRENPTPIQLRLSPVRLVTISTPFDGIQASAHCGLTTLHILTAGITAAVCQGIAGSMWTEIHPRANFVRNPGPIADSVLSHLKIVTDERGTCRRFGENGRCRESDFVFSLDEQKQEFIDSDRRVTSVQIKAGHAVVVGDENTPPHALLEILRIHGILQDLPPGREAEMQSLLAQLY